MVAPRLGLGNACHGFSEAMQSFKARDRVLRFQHDSREPAIITAKLVYVTLHCTALPSIALYCIAFALRGVKQNSVRIALYCIIVKYCVVLH